MAWDGQERRSERRHHPMQCLHEHEWGEIQQYIKNQDERWARMENKVVKHIDEGERSGGIRDRVSIVEIKVADIEKLKQGYWRAGLIGGIIGSLFAQAAPEVLGFVVRAIFK